MMLDTLYKLPLKIDFYLQGFPCFYDLFNGGEQVFPVHRLRGKVPDAFSAPPRRAVPFLLVGKPKPPQFSRFVSGFEPGESSRRETGPCTESGGSSCSGCCRSWRSFGSTPPPACRTRRSAFGTNSRILEEDVSGMEAGKGRRRWAVSLGPSPRRTQPLASSLGCLGESLTVGAWSYLAANHAWPWRDRLIYFSYLRVYRYLL